MTTPGRDTSNSLRLSPTPEASARARHFLEDFARDHDGPADACLEEGRLAVSELVSNAVQHAGTPLVVRLFVAGDGLEVSVADESPDTPSMQPPDPGRIGGRGLILIDRMSQCWGVLMRQSDKIVWCFLRPRRQYSNVDQPST